MPQIKFEYGTVIAAELLHNPKAPFLRNHLRPFNKTVPTVNTGFIINILSSWLLYNTAGGKSDKRWCPYAG